jgi:hypothetical protein
MEYKICVLMQILPIFAFLINFTILEYKQCIPRIQQFSPYRCLTNRHSQGRLRKTANRKRIPNEIQDRQQCDRKKNPYYPRRKRTAARTKRFKRKKLQRLQRIHVPLDGITITKKDPASGA